MSNQETTIHNRPTRLTGAEILWATLEGEGVREVFGYPGLYVLDGGALPAATGVNPSHTIAAVAERNVEAAIRKLTGDAIWRAPETASAHPIKDPLTGI